MTEETKNYDWYVVRVLSGKEMKVQKYLENAIRQHGYDERIVEVLIPTETVVEMQHGKKKTVNRKFFPGYVLVKMEMTEEAQSFVSNIPGVIDFLKGGPTPKPMSEDEYENIRSRMEGKSQEQRMEIPFSVGDPVKVVDGPFKDFAGIIKEVNPERGKVKVMVSIFGRLTPVEVDFLQIKEDRK
ncbi:MAG: transcription termination/antitermination protein NusG [Candidatus Zixiibacteriota bacterium]